MTDEARLNLQRGVPENPFYPATTYNIESDLDRWIWQHVKIMDKVKEQDRKKEQEKALADYIEQEVGAILEKKLDELLAGFNTL